MFSHDGAQMGKKDDASREGTGELPFLSKKVSTQTKPKDMSEVNTNADKKKHKHKHKHEAQLKY